VTHAEKPPYFDRRDLSQVSPTRPYVSQRSLNVPKNLRAEQSGTFSVAATEIGNFVESNTKGFLIWALAVRCTRSISPTQVNATCKLQAVCRTDARKVLLDSFALDRRE